MSDSFADFGSPDRELTSVDIKQAMNKPLAKSVTLEGPWADDLDLSPLSACKDAEYLVIGHADNFRLSSFPTMTGIKKVSIRNLSGDVLIDDCSSFPNLDIFGIYKSDNVRSTNLDGLSQHEKLAFVTINDTGIKSLDLTPLSTLRQLRGLTVESSSIQKLDFCPLKHSDTLQSLHLRFNHSLRELDLGSLPEGIRDLIVTGSDFGTLDLSPLENFRSLMNLNISENNLREIDLSPLAHCSFLSSVSLRNNLLSAVDLKPLRACTWLGTLDLGGMQLSEVDLSPLASSRLDLLRLDMNPLNELDLTPLKECKHLMRINILFCDKLEVVDVTPLLSLNCEVSHHINTRLIGDKRFQTDAWEGVEWY